MCNGEEKEKVILYGYSFWIFLYVVWWVILELLCIVKMGLNKINKKGLSIYMYFLKKNN